MMILLIDSDLRDLEDLKTLIEDFGHKAQVAKGFELVETIVNVHTYSMIMICENPVNPGFRAYMHAIDTSVRNSFTPIVATVNAIDLEKESNLRRYGCTAVFKKSSNMKTMEDRFEQLIAKLEKAGRI